MIALYEIVYVLPNATERTKLNRILIERDPTFAFDNLDVGSNIGFDLFGIRFFFFATFSLGFPFRNLTFSPFFASDLASLDFLAFLIPLLST